MTKPVAIRFAETDLDAIATANGRVAVLVAAEGKLGQAGRRVNRLTKGAVARFHESAAFQKLAEGEAASLAYPAGMAAEALLVVRLE